MKSPEQRLGAPFDQSELQHLDMVGASAPTYPYLAVLIRISQHFLLDLQILTFSVIVRLGG